MRQLASSAMGQKYIGILLYGNGTDKCISGFHWDSLCLNRLNFFFCDNGSMLRKRLRMIPLSHPMDALEYNAPQMQGIHGVF